MTTTAEATQTIEGAFQVRFDLPFDDTTLSIDHSTKAVFTGWTSFTFRIPPVLEGVCQIYPVLVAGKGGKFLVQIRWDELPESVQDKYHSIEWQRSGSVEPAKSAAT